MTYTLEQFCQVLEPLKVLPSNKPVDGEFLGVYYRFLSSYPLDILSACVTKLMQTCKFFPTIAEFVSLIEGSGEDRALLAWDIWETAFYKLGPCESVDLGDRVLHKTVIELGMWAELEDTGIAWEYDPEKEKWQRKEFERHYRAYQKYPQEMLPAFIPGLYQIRNKRALLSGEANRWTPEAREHVARKLAEPVRRFVLPRPSDRPALMEPEQNTEEKQEPITREEAAEIAKQFGFNFNVMKQEEKKDA